MKVLKIILIFVAVICCIYVPARWNDIFHGSTAPVESTEYAAVEEKSDEIPTDKDQVRPFKDTEAAENAMKKADETKKQAAAAAEEAEKQAAAEEAEKQAAAAAENAKQAFREQIVANVTACNWLKVDKLLKNKDYENYVTPAERTAISSFYWDGEKNGKKGASRPPAQQKNINKAITEHSSKLKTIEDIVAFYRSDAIQNQVRPFKDTEAAENAMKKADETKKQAAAENAKRAFRKQIVVNVIACNWPKVDELLKNKDYVTPAERIAICSFYWDGEKGASRPAPQQKQVNRAITENSSKLKTIDDIVKFYRSDAIQSKIK